MLHYVLKIKSCPRTHAHNKCFGYESCWCWRHFVEGREHSAVNHAAADVTVYRRKRTFRSKSCCCWRLCLQEEENIPLRIMLLLMDEVFDLRNRNQWLRRRIVAILRQFVKTMFGDSINRWVLVKASIVLVHIQEISLWPSHEGIVWTSLVRFIY